MTFLDDYIKAIWRKPSPHRVLSKQQTRQDETADGIRTQNVQTVYDFADGTRLLYLLEEEHDLDSDLPAESCQSSRVLYEIISDNHTTISPNRRVFASNCTHLFYLRRLLQDA
ncbi:MAG: hypothetical protein Q4E16_01075 [Neisseria sp.]|nr:hypothetical protein [Neisseria sp.]